MIFRVIGMNEDKQLHEDSNDSIDMEHVADSAFDSIKVGDIMQGEVVTLDDEYVYVNVGRKSDGRVPLEEFDERPSVGDRFPVIAKESHTRDGVYQFSIKDAIAAVAWQDFLRNHGTVGSIISGKITETNQKGKTVECGGFKVFMPFSLSGDLKTAVSSKDEYRFKVKSIDEKKRSVIVSRKDFLDDEYRKNWEHFTASHKAGDIVEGEVVKFVEFGAFVRVEGIDALLHRNDMSWKNVFKQRKLLKLNEKRSFIILGINEEEKKVSLGLKQLVSDPWLNIEDRISVGNIVEGSIVTYVNTGVFVEIDEEIDGFLPNSELSWAHSNISAKDLFQKHSKISVMVTDIKKDERRLILSYRKTQPNPWQTIADRFPVGSVHKGVIKKILKFGMFVELADGIDGLVHISDISWEDPKEQLKRYSIGSEVEYKILDIKQDEMRVSCGIKQLQKSPWEIIKEKYKPKMVVSGTVSSVNRFGVFVKLEEKVEGLVHISEIPGNKTEALEKSFKVGDEVQALVLGVDVKKKRLSLSIKQFEYVSEKEEVNKILGQASSKTVTLGDMINLKLK